MKILLLGSDGYIGYPLFHRLRESGHHVACIDNHWRRCNAKSVIPVAGRIDPYIGIHVYRQRAELFRIVEEFRPESIIHLAQQPSGPYSMKGIEENIETHKNNLFGTLNVLYAMREYVPEAQLIKIGSMGEYGTPNCDIEESRIMPKQPPSWYHCTKVHDTHNIQFACRNWELNCTDIMQGVVYGCSAGGVMTRLDIDECFGTVINRFCAAAAVGAKLPIYGDGKQKRSFLPLEDSLQCIQLLVENPAEGYRVVNQFDRCYSINELAKIIDEVAPGTKTTYDFNPRDEHAHFYYPHSFILKVLGYKPLNGIKTVIEEMISVCKKYKDRIDPRVFRPEINWK